MDRFLGTFSVVERSRQGLIRCLGLLQGHRRVGGHFPVFVTHIFPLLCYVAMLGKKEVVKSTCLFASLSPSPSDLFPSPAPALASERAAKVNSNFAILFVPVPRKTETEARGKVEASMHPKDETSSEVQHHAQMIHLKCRAAAASIIDIPSCVLKLCQRFGFSALRYADCRERRCALQRSEPP